jgi:3-phosphoshikimate 1-carboxyvinyltransferase
MLGSLSEGKTEIHNFLQGNDCLSTIFCFRAMGIDIAVSDKNVTITGNGLRGLRKPETTLFAGNSGTTVRIISGILAAQNFSSLIDGDASIRKRPMKRIMETLQLMNGKINSVPKNGCAPLFIEGTRLKGITYSSPIASAQVKSSILFAGLYAEGQTTVIEPAVSRNHTELMFKAFNAPIQTKDFSSTIQTTNRLEHVNIIIPGDISSAAFFLAAGSLFPTQRF